MFCVDLYGDVVARVIDWYIRFCVYMREEQAPPLPRSVSVYAQKNGKFVGAPVLGDPKKKNKE